MNTSQGANPNLVFIAQQSATTLTTLGLIAGTIWLSLTGQIHDGEVVTLLMAALGVHVVSNTKPATVADNLATKSELTNNNNN